VLIVATDGRLTISNAPGSANKIAFVEIQQTGAGPSRARISSPSTLECRGAGCAGERYGYSGGAVMAF
jgi:hypothetical protein